jgi:hypothetical protein
MGLKNGGAKLVDGQAQAWYYHCAILHGAMMKSVDIEDLKSSGRKAVRVRVPLAPLLSKAELSLFPHG